MILKFDEFINETWMERSHYETQHLYGTDPHFKRMIDNGELHFAIGADEKPMKVIKGEIFYGEIWIGSSEHNKDELPIFVDCFTDNPRYISGVVNIDELAQIFIKKEIRWYYITNKSYGSNKCYIVKGRYRHLGKPDNFDEDTLIRIQKPLRKTYSVDDVKRMIMDRKEPSIFVKVVVNDIDGNRLKLSVVDAFNTREDAETDMLKTLKK